MAILVPVELSQRPFRSAYAWARKWLPTHPAVAVAGASDRHLAWMIATTKLITVVAKGNTSKRFRTCATI